VIENGTTWDNKEVNSE